MIRRKPRPEPETAPEAAEPLPNTPEEQMNAVYRLTLKWTRQLEKSRITEYIQLLNRPWRMVWLSLLSGIARGWGSRLGLLFLRQRSSTSCSSWGH